MNNLSFEELKALSVTVADSTLLEKVSGGTASDCHDTINVDLSPPRDNTGNGSWGG